MNNRIVCAAMLMTDGLVVTGVRHYSPEMRKVLKKLYGTQYHLKVREQGFVDRYSNFVTREAALSIVKKSNQPIRGNITNQKLYSENLY